MFADALDFATRLPVAVPHTGVGNQGRSRPMNAICRRTQVGSSFPFVDHVGLSGVKDDARVLLLLDVIVGIAGARSTGKEAGWIFQDEVPPTISALPQRDTAWERNRVAARVYYAGRLVAGVQVRPVLAPAPVDGIRLAHGQAHVVCVDHPDGFSGPKVVQAGWCLPRRARGGKIGWRTCRRPR